MLVITGMHRSGTSLVARLFHLAGADLGDLESLYPGDRWNPEGYFEQREVLELNMRLVHGPWWKLAYLRLPSTGTILRRAAGERRRLQRTSARFAGRVVKDCRFCLTLPAWLDHGARVDGVLVCLREPIEVARSLRRRNRIGLTRGLRLWATHCRRLLDNTRGQRVGFVLYRNLLSPEHFQDEMDRAFRFAGLELTGDEIERLRRTTVRAPAHDAGPTAADYPPEVAALWHTLLARHAALPELAASPTAPAHPR